MTSVEVEDLVQERLTKCSRRLTGYGLQVKRGATRQEDEWWYVVVVPDKDGVRATQYAELLAEVEEELEAQAPQEKILLVPALVGV